MKMTKKETTNSRSKSFLLTVLAYALLFTAAFTAMQRFPRLVVSKPLASSSSSSKDDDASPGSINDSGGLIEYAPPINKGRTLKKIMNWGLSKIENAVYGDVRISDLIDAFAAKCDAIFAIMVRSVLEVYRSYDELLLLEKDRLTKFDAEFADLVKLRHRIERKCTRVTTVDDRSMCVDRGMDIRDKIDDLRGKRSRSIDAISRYEGMIEWCKSYGNWFC